MPKFSDFNNLAELKEYFSIIKDSLPVEASQKIDSTIKNLEIIQRKPETKCYVIGGQKTYHAVHKDGKTPYSKEELAKLNLIESIPELVLGEREYPSCQHCGTPLQDGYGNRLSNKSKFCSKLCSASHYRLNKKREEVGAVGVFIVHDEKKPAGQRPYWKDLDAIFEKKLKTKTKFVKKKLTTKKGRNYDKVKAS